MHFFGHGFAAKQFGFFGFIKIVVSEQAATRRQTERCDSKQGAKKKKFHTTFESR
jgi:hypothetical protein